MQCKSNVYIFSFFILRKKAILARIVFITDNNGHTLRNFTPFLFIMSGRWHGFILQSIGLLRFLLGYPKLVTDLHRNQQNQKKV